jgi:hypothetical protein
MKLTNLIWVLALAVAVSACNSGSLVQGCDLGQGINGAGQCEACAPDQIVDSVWICANCDAFEGIVGPRDCAPCADNQCVNARGRCEDGARVGSNGECEDNTGGTGGTGGSVGGACTNDADQAVYDDLEYTDADGDDHTGSGAASAIASDCVFGGPDTLPPDCAGLATAVVGCAIVMACTPAQVTALAECVGDCAQNTIESITGSRLSDGCAACYSSSVACSAAKCATVCSNPAATPCVECRCVQGCTPEFDVCSGLPPSGVCDPFL